MSEFSPRTIAAQALGRIDEATRALVPPLHVATTFIRDPDNGYSSGNIYGTALFGGTNSNCGSGGTSGCGNVWEITP